MVLFVLSKANSLPYLGNLIDVLKAGIETLKTVYNSRAVGTMNVEEGIQTDLMKRKEVVYIFIHTPFRNSIITGHVTPWNHPQICHDTNIVNPIEFKDDRV